MKILAFAGATRAASLNRLALTHAVEGARAAGAEVTVIDLRDFALPVYDGEREAEHGVPEAAQRLKATFKSHHALLLACPEYNGSITPLLKNTLDWVSREWQGESGLVPYSDKLAALVSASPGQWGGMRGLRHVREVLTILGVDVIPKQHCVVRAADAFPEDGPANPREVAALASVGKSLAGALRRWHSK